MELQNCGATAGRSCDWPRDGGGRLGCFGMLAAFVRMGGVNLPRQHKVTPVSVNISYMD